MKFFSRRRIDEDPADSHVDLIDDDDETPWYKRRNVTWPVLGVLIVVILFGGWLGLRAYEAKTSLEAARTSAQQAKDALLQGNTADASRLAADAQSHAQSARNATHSVPWNVMSVVPWLGSPFKKTGQQISDVVLGLAAEVLKPTADAGTTVAPRQLLANGRLDVQALRREEPVLSKIAADATRLDAEAKAISAPAYFSVVGEARSQLQSQTSNIAGLLENTALAAKLAPSMLGADGPRSYFMGFQTNAEARGTGGLLGGDSGSSGSTTASRAWTLWDRTPISTSRSHRSQSTQSSTSSTGSPIQLPTFGTAIRAHIFPYTAQIWKQMWAQQSGMNVDGVIAIDPIALSYILGATGPIVMPDGETVTKDNVVELTESTVYSRFPPDPNDQSGRKRFLQEIATQVVKKITVPIESPRTLLDALGRAVSERRISVWSSSAADQALLEKTPPLAHEIPDDPAPYAEVVINNLGGNKMDYYLKREIEYVADGCDGEKNRKSTVTIRLTNTLKDVAGLPEYVVGGRLGFYPEVAGTIPPGTMLTSVRLLTTRGGADVLSVLANGKKRTRVFFGSTERGHPSFESQVAIPPGNTVELIFPAHRTDVCGRGACTNSAPPG